MVFLQFGKYDVSQFTQGFGREKDENRSDICLSSFAFSFESGSLGYSILVIKMVVRFQASRRNSGINNALEMTQELITRFLKIIIE